MDITLISGGLIAGLGLFLFGLTLMSDGLQKVAGDRMRKWIAVLTETPIMGVAVGTVVTMIFSSSSAVTVMVIGFVNAGLMTLKQAVGVILGSNIGTTFSTQLITFDIGAMAPFAIGIGVILYMFSKKKRHKEIGEIILGFGILFFGITTMTAAVAPLRSYQPFIDALAQFATNPILGVVVGAIFTAIVQSSSATTAIVVTLAQQGLISLEAAIPLIFGSNIGTTITAFLASLNSSVTARKAALAHTLFNVGGTVLFMFILKPFTNLAAMTSTLVNRQIANAHTIFNLGNTLLVLPFISGFTALVNRLIPGEDAAHDEFVTLYLDKNLLENPSIALGQVKLELNRMGDIALENLDLSYKALVENDMQAVAKAAEKEKLTNYLEREIMDYLIKISGESMNERDTKIYNALFESANDIERVGDHAENIADLAVYKIENELPFSDDAIAELDEMYNIVHEMFIDSMKVLDEYQPELAGKIYEQETVVDMMEKQLRRSHIQRVSDGLCNPRSGIVFLDTISNLERVADHSNNLAVRARFTDI